ncbi:MAG: hypothetical protein AAF483_15805 [Planctomycetota bacterium]
MNQTTADEVLAQILDSGVVTAAQVGALQKCVDADWVVDKQEAETLLRANHALGENDEDCPEWGDFFIASITKLLVRDMETPGEIDPQEGDWLGNALELHGVNNSSQQRLLREIKETTSKIEGKAKDFID